MRDQQLEQAMSMVKSEVSRIAMCKRGVVETEYNKLVDTICTKASDMKKPKYTKAELKAQFKLHRDSLVKCLRLRVVPEQYNRLTSLYTDKSIEKYNLRLNEITMHPDLPKYRKDIKAFMKRESVAKEQRAVRIDAIDAEVRRLTMGFLTGAIRYGTESTRAIEVFEQGVW